MSLKENHIYRFTCDKHRKKFRQYLLEENPEDPGFCDFLCENCKDEIFYFIAPLSNWSAKLYRLIAKRVNSEGTLLIGDDDSDYVTVYSPGLFCLALHLVRLYKQEYGSPNEGSFHHPKELAKISLKILKKEKQLLENLKECLTDLGPISKEELATLKQTKLKRVLNLLNIFK